MKGTSPSPGQPIHPAARRRPIPLSVIYPQVLLFVQACCWVSATEPQTWTPGDVPVAWSALFGILATAKFMLGLRVGQRPSKRVWLAVIAAEVAMTGLGVLWLALPASGFTIFGFFGACLSVAAVVCMTRPRARQYFTGPGAVPGTPDPDALSGPAGFRALRPASWPLAII